MTRATIEEVAVAAGVSRSTVSRVVNGSTAVSPEAFAAVTDAIERMRYTPHRAARSLASRQTHAIALVVPENTRRFFGDPFFAEIVSGISARLTGSDYILNLLIASDDPRDKMTSFMRNGGVDAAIIVSHHTSDAFVDRIAETLPVVFGGRPERRRDTDFVVDVDNVAAGRTATEHLLARGRRRLAMVAGPLTMPAGIDRVDGFRAALADAGFEPVAVVEGGFAEDVAREATRELLAGLRASGEPAPDAIFAASDLMARGVMTALQGAGLRVPEDVALIGVDDSPVAVATDPALSTVRQPLHDMGETMVQVLLDHLAGRPAERTTILPTELVVRASS
ncbi:LacI family DNA-binding transcriptional regulator [Microbacterium pseudoresistens]|uniref:DNA-binding LacI/PurR family transcriptional regulator n=1 Tax=Microbacterium pseudoresistens TaxID=640634 RepID=A0A7Y9EU37_9MICO|nr:DNA-binding LacI/PurR family transcriptional regulator [Microbacterium pseudoresistens]